jgi:hypothetical protein
MARTNKFNTYEEAQEAQTAGKAKVRDAKQALTDYLKKNKLKRNVDYSEDKKHSSKLVKLNNSIEKTSSSLDKVNDQVKELKPKKDRVSKYDYPDGITSEEKKKFRQKARSDANGDEKKASKPKKEKKESSKVKKDSSKAKKTSTKKVNPKKGKRSKKND